MHAYLSFGRDEHIIDVEMVKGSLMRYFLEKLHNRQHGLKNVDIISLFEPLVPLQFALDGACDGPIIVLGVNF
jgi:hypothetical protein